MTTKQLIEKFKGVNKNEKITLKIKDIMNNTKNLKCKYLGEIKQNGYISESGSWGFCDTGKFGEKECFDVLVRLKNQRYNNWLHLEYKVLDFEIGWDK